MWRAQGSHPLSRACPSGSNQSFSLPFLLLAELVHGGRRGGNPFLISICLKSSCPCWRQKMETAGWPSHSQQQGPAYALLLTRYCRKQGRSRHLQHLGHTCGAGDCSNHPASGRRGQGEMPQQLSSAHQLH